MSIILITGSSGLVGSESVNFFSKKGFDVIGIDNNLRKFFFGNEGSTNKVKNDLCKFQKLPQLSLETRIFKFAHFFGIALF